MYSMTVLLFSCAGDREKIEAFDHMREILSTEYAEDIEVIHTDSGYIKVVLTAPKAITNKYADDPYTEMPDGLYAVFYNKKGDQDSYISAQYGISYDKRDVVVLKHKVEVVNTLQEKLNTEELTWNRQTKKIYTDKFVTITTPEETISGYDMEADEDFSNWTLKKATGTFNLAP
jgi:LPS export ABC transporter protein LptC